MSVRIVHVVRGKCKDTGKKYKLVRGQLKQLYEARGEDEFDSVFFAIYSCVRAAAAWRSLSPSVIFNVEAIERKAEGPPVEGEPA
jgi:hypothetical protein